MLPTKQQPLVLKYDDWITEVVLYRRAFKHTADLERLSSDIRGKGCSELLQAFEFCVKKAGRHVEHL